MKILLNVHASLPCAKFSLKRKIFWAETNAPPIRPQTLRPVLARNAAGRPVV